jgi:hypothetical protein
MVLLAAIVLVVAVVHTLHGLLVLVEPMVEVMEKLVVETTFQEALQVMEVAVVVEQEPVQPQEGHLDITVLLLLGMH